MKKKWIKTKQNKIGCKKREINNNKKNTSIPPFQGIYNGDFFLWLLVLESAKNQGFGCPSHDDVSSKCLWAWRRWLSQLDPHWYGEMYIFSTSRSGSSLFKKLCSTQVQDPIHLVLSPHSFRKAQVASVAVSARKMVGPPWAPRRWCWSVPTPEVRSFRGTGGISLCTRQCSKDGEKCCTSEFWWTPVSKDSLESAFIASR